MFLKIQMEINFNFVGIVNKQLNILIYYKLFCQTKIWEKYSIILLLSNLTNVYMDFCRQFHGNHTNSCPFDKCKLNIVHILNQE